MNYHAALLFAALWLGYSLSVVAWRLSFPAIGSNLAFSQIGLDSSFAMLLRIFCVV